MNIYKRELRAHLKSLMIWCLGMMFLCIVGMTKYSAGLNAGGSLNEMMKAMPASLQNLFNVSVFNLSIAIEYYGIIFLYIALLATIQAVMLGSSIISKEEMDKTVEFLMVKPISRESIITSKLLAALTMIIIMNIVTTISSYLAINNFNPVSPFIGDLLKLMGGLFILQLIFLCIGAFFAGLIPNPKLSSAIATGVLLVTFLIYIVINTSGRMDFLKYFSPFKYYDAKYILKGGFLAIFPNIIHCNHRFSGSRNL